MLGFGLGPLRPSGLVALVRGLLGADLDLLSLFFVAAPPRAGVGQPFGGDGQVAVELAQGHLHLGQFPGHDGPVLLGPGPVARAASPGGSPASASRCRSSGRSGPELVVAGLHAAGPFGEVVEHPLGPG